MSSHEKALKKAGGKVKVNNSVKGFAGKLDEKGNKVKEPYKFVRTLGAKNNDTQEE